MQGTNIIVATRGIKCKRILLIWVQMFVKQIGAICNCMRAGRFRNFMPVSDFFPYRAFVYLKKLYFYTVKESEMGNIITTNNWWWHGSIKSYVKHCIC